MPRSAPATRRLARTGKFRLGNECEHLARRRHPRQVDGPRGRSNHLHAGLARDIDRRRSLERLPLPQLHPDVHPGVEHRRDRARHQGVGRPQVLPASRHPHQRLLLVRDAGRRLRRRRHRSGLRQVDVRLHAQQRLCRRSGQRRLVRVLPETITICASPISRSRRPASSRCRPGSRTRTAATWPASATPCPRRALPWPPGTRATFWPALEQGIDPVRPWASPATSSAPGTRTLQPPPRTTPPTTC